MNRTVSVCALLCVAAVLAATAVAQPALLSDKNRFLHDLVGTELLNVLGVILAISLASAANLHLEFNKIEERYNKKGLTKSRDGIKRATYWLISLFLIGIVVVVVKPVVGSSDLGEAIFNSLGLFVLFWNVLVLSSLVQAAFAITPEIKQD